MEEYLNLNNPPKYKISAFRYFHKGEKHITRCIPDSVLLMVFSGTLRFYEDGQPVEVNEGEYYIQRPFVQQRGIEESDLPKFFYIHFLNAEYQDSPQKGLYYKGKFSYMDLQPFFTNLNYYHKSQSATKVLTHATFYQILDNLHHYNQAITKDCSIARKVEKYLSEHFTDKYPLADICENLHYSKNYIIRLFEKTYEQTPHRYVLFLRVEQAKLLLSSTDYTIEQIATQCGYDDIPSFYKVFYAMTDMTPKAWKQEHRRSEI